MGRLVSPGTGEITDRLTILSLKLLFGEQAGRDVSHFKTERTALLSMVRSKTLNGVWFDRVLELAAVNAALWHAEDDLRELKVPFRTKAEEWLLVRVADLAFRIQELNDTRAGLVERINKDTGDTLGVGVDVREKVTV